MLVLDLVLDLVLVQVLVLMLILVFVLVLMRPLLPLSGIVQALRDGGQGLARPEERILRSGLKEVVRRQPPLVAGPVYLEQEEEVERFAPAEPQLVVL